MQAATTLHRAWLLVMFSIALIASTPAAAQPGTLDPTFGQGGIVTTDLGTQYLGTLVTANAVAIQPDGKIVVCGGIPNGTSFPVAAVVRYNTDGSLDTGFGTSGVAVTQNGTIPTAI